MFLHKPTCEFWVVLRILVFLTELKNKTAEPVAIW